MKIFYCAVGLIFDSRVVVSQNLIPGTYISGFLIEGGPGGGWGIVMQVVMRRGTAVAI